MIEELKVFLGDAVDGFTDAQLGLALKFALAEVEAYTKRKLDYELEVAVMQIAKIKLNRLNTEGLIGAGFNGVSESYIDGYPDEVKALLNSKRKMKAI